MARPTDYDRVQLVLNPQLCMLAENELHCEVNVDISWRSEALESLCVFVLEHPEVDRCWDNYSKGQYSIALTFSNDLVVELREKVAGGVVASATLAVVREILRYRFKRRKPWNLFQ